MSTSHNAILDRDYAIATANRFQDALELVNELLDYGTNLVPRAFVSSPRDLKAICLIFFQLRQFIAHLDGVAILISSGNCFTANLQLRSLLESSSTLEWVLKSDTDSKINHLYVANLRQRRQWQSRVIPGTSEATRHATAVSNIKLSSEELQEITDEVNRIDTLLAQSPFDAINAKFEPYYLNHGFDQPWYKVYGVSSIRKIIEDLGNLKYYDYIYSPLSGVSHGSDMWKSIEIGDQNISVNPIREPQGIPGVVQLAVSLSLHVYRLILNEYRYDEIESFNRKYIAEWRERFLHRYQIELTPKELIV